MYVYSDNVGMNKCRVEMEGGQGGMATLGGSDDFVFFLSSLQGLVILLKLHPST